MNSFPPEKYYEACITYHLVNIFKERYDRLLYPFSISQLEENSKGFDFGYTFSSESFYIQYKRPFSFDDQNLKSNCSWQIDRSQLNTLNSQPYALKTYYALPAFININLWFEGIENTFFVDSYRLQDYLNKKNLHTKTNLIQSNIKILESGNIFPAKFLTKLQNAVLQNQRNLTKEKILQQVKNLSPEIKNCTWVYLLEEK